MDSRENLWMRLPKPKLHHPHEVYQAIIQEHQDSPVRIGERLMACGWTLADAAWAAVNWDLPTLAAAVANERAKRDTRLTTPSEGEIAKLKAEIAEAKKSPSTTRPKRTTRIVQTTPRVMSQPLKKADQPEA